MSEIHEIRDIARELFIESYSELEHIKKIDKLRMTLVNGCDSHIQLGQIKSRLNLLLNSQSKQKETEEFYTIQNNKIVKALIDITSKLDIDEVVTPFEKNNEDIVFLIFDHDEKFLYKFEGNLVHNSPEGGGKAIYPNNDYYIGNFKNGLREGRGILFDKKNRIIDKGTWRNDQFVDDNGISFYSDIRVAASIVKNPFLLPESHPELMVIPNLDTKDVIAFPIEGNSMLPTYSENDIIVCKELDNLKDFENNKTYIVFHEDNLVIKIVQKYRTRKGETNFRLISENYIDYPSYPIAPNEHTKLFKILLHIKKY